jgi:hypothetical protein
MMIKASGRSALILATGLFAGLFAFAGPSQATPASADDTTAASSAESATVTKSVKQSSRHGKRYARSNSGKAASKPPEAKKAAETDTTDAGAGAPSVIPASVANANAQLTSAYGDPAADNTKDNANAMTAKASTMLQAAADKLPADAQSATDAQVVASDQLNDVDRALQQNPISTPTQTVAMASAKPTAAAPVLASSNESSTWDQTSLIGKIFIAFGALLTMASAARMFMA